MILCSTEISAYGDAGIYSKSRLTDMALKGIGRNERAEKTRLRLWEQLVLPCIIHHECTFTL